MGEIDIHVKSEVQRSWRVGVLLAMMGAREKVLSSKLGLIWFKKEAQLNSHLLRSPPIMDGLPLGAYSRALTCILLARNSQPRLDLLMIGWRLL